MSHRILILNGPNLNLLGLREPEIYGHDTIDDLNALCIREAQSLGMDAECRQSNHEGLLVDWIQSVRTDFDGLIINPAAYSHTSIALLDALSAIEKPIVEVHLSNIHKREDFRHLSYVSKVADGVICGLGKEGYRFAIHALARLLSPVAPATIETHK